MWTHAARYLGHVELPEPEESDMAAIRKIKRSWNARRGATSELAVPLCPAHTMRALRALSGGPPLHPTRPVHLSKGCLRIQRTWLTGQARAG